MLFLSCFVMLSCTSVCRCLVVTCWDRVTSWLSFVMSNYDVILSHWYPGPGVVLDCIDS